MFQNSLVAELRRRRRMINHWTDSLRNTLTSLWPVTFSSHLIRRAQNSLFIVAGNSSINEKNFKKIMWKCTLLYSLHVSLWVSDNFLPSMFVFNSVLNDLISRLCLWSDCEMLWIMWCSRECETDPKTHGNVLFYIHCVLLNNSDHWDSTNKLCLAHIIISMNWQVNICFRKRSQ